LGLSLVPWFLVWDLAVTFLADLDVLLVGLLAFLLEAMKHVNRITAVTKTLYALALALEYADNL